MITFTSTYCSLSTCYGTTVNIRNTHTLHTVTERVTFELPRLPYVVFVIDSRRIRDFITPLLLQQCNLFLAYLLTHLLNRSELKPRLRSVRRLFYSHVGWDIQKKNSRGKVDILSTDKYILAIFHSLVENELAIFLYFQFTNNPLLVQFRTCELHDINCERVGTTIYFHDTIKNV